MPGHCEKWESMVVVAVRPRGLGGGVLETELIKEGLTSHDVTTKRATLEACQMLSTFCTFACLDQ